MWVALGAQIVPPLVIHASEKGLRFGILIGSYLLVAAALGLMLGRAARRTLGTGQLVGMGLLAVGWLLNLAVIALNRGMPVSGWALARAGRDPDEDVEVGNFYKHVPLDGETRLRLLADVIPVAPLGIVISAGDVALAAGCALVVVAAMRSAPATNTALVACRPR